MPSQVHSFLVSVNHFYEALMTSELTPEEQSYLTQLLADQSRRTSTLRLTSNILLVVGGLLLAGTALYISQHMTDATAYTVGLPNFVGGMLLIGCYLILSKRATNTKLLYSILKKLSHTGIAA